MISFGKIRPQIFMAIALLGAITGYAIYSDMVEIATGTVGGHGGPCHEDNGNRLTFYSVYRDVLYRDGQLLGHHGLDGRKE